MDTVRRRALRLPHAMALLGVCEWVAAGVAYPIALRLAVGELPTAVYVHFFASLALCGLVAAAYPFFLVTALVVRGFYPALLRQGGAADDGLALADLTRRMSLYVLVAGTVPMLAMTLLVYSGSENRLALAVVSGVGLLGFGLAFVLYRSLAVDIAALAEAVRGVDQDASRSG